MKRSASLIMVTANIIGAIVYVVKASAAWAIPQERGLHSETGEPFVWFTAILPVIAVFALLNIFWEHISASADA